MATRTSYQIVGRYMDGSEVTGYHLHCIDNGKSKRFTKEQVYFLVGRGQVTNCDGQLYNDKVLLRGVGMSLEDLPVASDRSGEIKNAVGKTKKDATIEDALTQLLIVTAIVKGRNTVGYVLQNAGGATKALDRAQVMSLAQAGKIGNATVQNNNGALLLRGVGTNLSSLPTVTVEQLEANS